VRCAIVALGGRFILLEPVLSFVAALCLCAPVHLQAVDRTDTARPVAQSPAAQPPAAPPQAPAPKAPGNKTPDDGQKATGTAAPEGPPAESGGRLVVTGDTVVVVGDPDVPIDRSSIATKTDTPLLETPRSVSITDRRTLDDRQAIDITNAHDYTVGVMPADDRGPAFARGFPMNFYDVRRDGLRTYAWSIREPVGLDRVQYLRGPAAILYGDGSPGGLVNLVLKKPLPLRRPALTPRGGGRGLGRFTADTTGPVGADREARYRLIGAGEWLENGYDNGERRLSLLPMMSFDLGASATLTVDGELYHQRGRNYRHTVPVTPDTQHGDFSKVPWGFNAASPDDHWSGWNASPGVRLDARIGRRTDLHTAVRYTRIGGDIEIEALLNLAPDGRTVNRYNYFEQSTWNELQSDSFVTTSVTTGRLAHEIVVGVEAGLSTADSVIGVGAAPPVDLYDPVYLPKPAPPPTAPTKYDVLRVGLYAQDQLRISRSVIVVPAVRWSRLGVNNRVPVAGGAAPDSTDYAVSPGVGVVVLPRENLSLYASASTGFEPPSPGEYLADGRPLSPADTASVESGVKASLLHGALDASGAVFRIRRTNVAEANGDGSYSQIAEGVSHGVEMELTGRLTRGLGVQAGYAWTDTEVTRDLSGFVGRELPNAPHHEFSAWARYRVQDGPMHGLMVASGLVYVSSRYIAGNNVNVAPAYARVDLSASYAMGQSGLGLAAGVENLGNVRYVTSGAGQVLFAGAARRVTAQLVARF
jgi:iron complex outermembrane receptor protein